MSKIISFTNHQSHVDFAVRKYNLHKSLRKLNFTFRYLGPPRNFYLRNFNGDSFSKILDLITLRHKSDTWLHFDNTVNPYFVKLVRKITNSKIFFDIRDNQNNQAKAYGIGLDDRTKRNREIYAKRNAEIADVILVTSESQRRSYPSDIHKKIFVVENASDPSHFNYRPPPRNYTLGVATGLTKGRGLENFLESAKIVKEEISKLKVKIAFSRYPNDQYPDYLMSKFDYNWIHFDENISYSNSAPDFFSSTDIMVIPHPKNTYFDEIIPVKLFDSMAAGRAVLTTDCLETSKVVKKYNCGVICDSTVSDMSSKLIEMLKDMDNVAHFGKRGRIAIIDSNNWDCRANLIMNILSSIE